MSPTTTRKSSTSWQDNLTIALGIWLGLSPAILGFSSVSPENWITVGSGVVLIVLMIGARLAFHVWEEWLGVVFGALIAIAPWIAGFTASTRPTVNCIVCGLAVMVLTGWRIIDFTRHHGEMTAQIQADMRRAASRTGAALCEFRFSRVSASRTR